MRVIRSCFIVCFILFLASCGSKPEKAIIGKWVTEEDETIEFLKDGKVRFGEEMSGSYEFIDKNRMRLEPPDKDPVIVEVQVPKDKLSLTFPNGLVMKFARREHLEELRTTGKLVELNLEARLKAMTTEATQNLAAIRIAQAAYRAENGVYLECKPSPPDGGTDAVPDPWVDAGGFTQIGFAPDGSPRFQYAVTVGNNSTTFTATAVGDLNKNGIKVTYTVTNTNPKPTGSPANEY